MVKASFVSQIIQNCWLQFQILSVSKFLCGSVICLFVFSEELTNTQKTADKRYFSISSFSFKDVNTYHGIHQILSMWANSLFYQ